MQTALFSNDVFDRMAAEVRQVLFGVGYVVDHPGIREAALRAGCRASPRGRVLFCEEQIQEVRARLLRQYPPAAPGGPEPGLVHPRRQLRGGIGNLAPKVYDYRRGEAVAGTRDRLIELVKFAQMEPRVSGISLPLSRQDVPPPVEQLAGLVEMAKFTDKRLGALDVTVPEAVPFVAEMGAALGCNPAAFVGSCNCINPPLRLERRTAETMLQRRRYHSMSMITPMPCIGGNAPADIYGSIVQGTAEIVGGLILSVIIDPEAPLLGYIACNQVDMLTGNGTSCTPQTVRVDAGVYQLMEHAFGGGTRVGGRSYINARRPGLQALFERFLKAVGYAGLVDRHALSYAGHGCLDNGSMISPEQFLLDAEVLAGLDELSAAPVVPPPGDAAARIREAVINGDGSFVASEHTLNHYRDEMWAAGYFRCDTHTRGEQDILDQCHAEYRQGIDAYQPASQPAGVLRELERILKRAEAALL
jgi:trimethylamine:corrinoid methyltransferase-like protein